MLLLGIGKHSHSGRNRALKNDLPTRASSTLFHGTSGSFYTAELGVELDIPINEGGKKKYSYSIRFRCLVHRSFRSVSA